MGINSCHRSAVFLDRDGVINRPFIRGGRPFPPSRVDELEVLPGVPNALMRLRDADFRLVVVTNQPDVGYGRVEIETVEEMHRRLAAMLPVDSIEACFHGRDEGCDCRKPLPGMLLRAAQECGIDLTQSWMVGDRWRELSFHAGGAVCLLWLGRWDDGVADVDALIGVEAVL